MTDQQRNTSEKRVIAREFSKRVEQGRRGDVTVVYRVAGGMPSERRVEEVVVRGDGKVEARLSDRLQATPAREASLELDEAEAAELFAALSAGIEKLAEHAAVGFPPDSLVGSITAEVEGRAVTFYFLPDEAERVRHGKQLPAEATRAIEGFQRLSERVFRQGGKR